MQPGNGLIQSVPSLADPCSCTKIWSVKWQINHFAEFLRTDDSDHDLSQQNLQWSYGSLPEAGGLAICSFVPRIRYVGCCGLSVGRLQNSASLPTAVIGTSNSFVGLWSWLFFRWVRSLGRGDERDQMGEKIIELRCHFWRSMGQVCIALFCP